jgi:hypothetical protein
MRKKIIIPGNLYFLKKLPKSKPALIVDDVNLH